MAEEAGANTGNQNQAGSPPVKDGSGNGSGTPAGAQNTVPKPFHETLKEMMGNPEFKDFFDRQVERKAQDKSGAQQKSQQQEDEDVKMLMQKFDITEENAKGLVLWRDQGVDKKLKPIMDQIHSQGTQQTLTARFSALRIKNPEMDEYSDEMVKVMGELSDSARKYVMDDPEGVEWLLEKTKKKYTKATVQDKIRGGGGSGRGHTFNDKTGGLNTNIDAASKLLNDNSVPERQRRENYERAIQNAMKQ